MVGHEAIVVDLSVEFERVFMQKIKEKRIIFEAMEKIFAIDATRDPMVGASGADLSVFSWHKG